jgi:cytochrome c-type biogenesis protein CcmH
VRRFNGAFAAAAHPIKPAALDVAGDLPPFEKGGQGGFALPPFLRSALLALALACLHAPLFAQVAANTAPLQFRDAAEERRFHALAAELRCVMCQNQSLADSNAQIAHDLRAEVLQLMRQGRSDAEIKQFLVQRYGEFVLYRPQVEAGTWLLWFGPLLLVIAGGVVVVRIVRQRSRTPSSATDDTQEW